MASPGRARAVAGRLLPSGGIAHVGATDKNVRRSRLVCSSFPQGWGHWGTPRFPASCSPRPSRLGKRWLQLVKLLQMGIKSPLLHEHGCECRQGELGRMGAKGCFMLAQFSAGCKREASAGGHWEHVQAEHRHGPRVLVCGELPGHSLP